MFCYVYEGSQPVVKFRPASIVKTPTSQTFVNRTDLYELDIGLVVPPRTVTKIINPYSAKLINLNFQPPEVVVARYRDSQLQVGQNYS